MDAEKFPSALEKYQAQMRNYVNNVFPRCAGEISLRFIDDNFRMQGWQGATFQPWPKTKKGTGTILVKTGLLRRGNYFTTQPALARLRNDVPYGPIHNNGFNGTVNVKAHRRIKFSKEQVATGRIKLKTGKEHAIVIHGVKSMQQVRQHTRKMNIPQRKFFPTSYDDSPVLMNQLIKEMSSGIQTIFK